MKYSNALIVLTLFSLCSMLKAQEQPLAFDRNMLAHSQGLPNDFLLFSPDTCVQILFNPARAAMSERRFVYASYLPDPNSSQTIFSNGSLTGAALFNAIGSTWLLQASNSLNRNSIDYSSNRQDYEEQINTSDLYNSLSNNSLLFNGSFTAIKLSLVGTAGENSYSVGAFGIFMPQTETLNSTHHSSDDYHYYDSINSYGYENHEVFRSDEQMERANSKYAIGLEFSLAGLGWDFITCLSFQKDKVNRISTVLSNDDYYRIYANSDVNTQTTIHSSTDKRTIEPGIYDIHGYFQHTADWITPTDNYFISTNFYYSGGDINYNEVSNSYYSYQYTGSSPTYDTTIYTINESERLHNWGGKLSFGYLVKRKLIDLDILVGLNPQIGYDEFKDMDPLYSASTEDISLIYKYKIWSTALQIPVYLNFTPAAWCSFFGGLNYRYTYVYEKVDCYQDIRYHYSMRSSVISFSGAITYSQLFSTNSVYAGMELRHASGLHIQIAFGDNLASYSRWNISLGYVY